MPSIGTGTLHLHVSCNLHASSSLLDMLGDRNNTVAVPIPNVLIAPKIRTKKLMSADSLYELGYFCQTDVNTGRFYLQHRRTGHVIPILKYGGLYYALARYNAVPSVTNDATFNVPNSPLAHPMAVPALTEAEALYLQSRRMIADLELWHQRRESVASATLTNSITCLLEFPDCQEQSHCLSVQLVLLASRFAVQSLLSACTVL